MTRSAVRKQALDWIEAGFSVLPREGVDGLRAERLARLIGATKGSFYWHFRNIDDYRARLLRRWVERALAQVHAVPESAPPARRLLEVTAPMLDSDGRAATEAAIRAWAIQEHTVANGVLEVDGARRAAASHLLSSLGLTNPDLPRLLVAAQVGMLGEPAGHRAESLTTLLAAFLALRDA